MALPLLKIVVTPVRTKIIHNSFLQCNQSALTIIMPLKFKFSIAKQSIGVKSGLLGGQLIFSRVENNFRGKNPSNYTY